MIFPGMDPYLENPNLWPDVHASLIIFLRSRLQPLLRPRYIARVEERVYVEGPERQIVPDVLLKRGTEFSRVSGMALVAGDEPIIVQVPELEIHETYVAILDRETCQRIVTVIEVTSPSNKNPGPGRDSYLQKQREVRGSETHLVEIDLLRSGDHVLAVPEWKARTTSDYSYLVSINRAEKLRDRFELYPRGLRERLPSMRIPLADGDPDVILDLQDVLFRTYAEGGYRDYLRYSLPCQPPLSAEDQDWANGCIQQAPVEE